MCFSCVSRLANADDDVNLSKLTRSTAVALQAAEAALDDAIASNDAAAISSCTRRLEDLQGTAARGETVDRASLPGSDVERDLAEALELAAIDAGDDVDTAGLLDELPLADLATRVSVYPHSNTYYIHPTHARYVA